MTASGNLVRIEVDDAAARYPLVIDPLFVSEGATLVAQDGQADGLFGRAVALDGDGSRAIVGVPGDMSAAGDYTGSARVLVHSGSNWTQEATLLDPTATWGDWFGCSVAVSADGTRALVGANFDHDSSGADIGGGYVFVRSGSSWLREGTLRVSGLTNSELGSSVALGADGTHALVGAPMDSVGASYAGSAYVFARSGSTWTQEAVLRSPNPSKYAFFGCSVALDASATRALIGASGDDSPEIGAGGVFAYVRNGSSWTLEATLRAPDAEADDSFGDSVSLSADGSRALIGASGDDSMTGSARIFVRSGSSWTQEAALVAVNGAVSDGLGWAVSLSADGTRALVGAPQDWTKPATGPGSAHLFVRGGSLWNQDMTLSASDGTKDDALGRAVALSGDGSQALVGAPDDDTPAGANAGSAHAYSFLPFAPDACTDASHCVTGHCVDGVCCDGACDEQCEACDATGHLGICTPVTGAAHGKRPSCVSDGSLCGGSCDGVHTAACVVPKWGVPWAAAACRASTAA